MNLRLFFDTETTGLPDWKEPSEAAHQPHLVSLTAELVDIDTRQVIQSMSAIIKPEGWTIPQEVIDIHGITNELAEAVGVREHLALATFIEMWNGACRVAHNCTFDNRIIRIATKRYCPESIINAWDKPVQGEDYECTGLLSKPIMQMEPKNRYGYKMPKLTEAYEFFTGQTLEGAHNSQVDVMACKAVYFAIKDQDSQKTEMENLL